ncbi:Arachidonate 5-lipoxygenase [Collichthys lucidus]|uniref:Arachidonate 5-lipoxygenase n=1 Tax=Collichthys lucidus TaxID=240159 RepID=A0A4U5VC31_COLLU|nr:Arachidonate 5-lipoxygenase [Collichthys lucidus]
MENQQILLLHLLFLLQEGMFLSSDAHRTVIQLVGSRGVSERVPLAERFPWSSAIGSSGSPAHHSRHLVLFEGCRETPEGGVSLFPCYRFVSRSTSLALRDSMRVNELTERRRTFRWSCYDDGLPETMKANNIMSLPAEARFSVSKATDMILTVSKVMVEHLWMEDWFFGYQFLNGANPTLIRRCKEIPPNMAVTEEMVGASLGGGASLCQEMETPHARRHNDDRPYSASIGSDLETAFQRGSVFLVDYRLLDALTANTVNRKQNYLTAPLILLHLNAHNQLLPIAIQVDPT